MVILENRIRDNIKTFNKVFNSILNNYQGFYSFKANYLNQVCEVVNTERFGAEVISLPELELALKVGFPPDLILAGGPYLPIGLIKKCVNNSIREIVVYRIDDLKKINEIAVEAGVSQNICLRINSGKYDSRLGINLENSKLIKLKKICQKYKNIKITTILSHLTTQMNDVKQFKQNLDTIINAKNKLFKCGIKVEKLNLGGGFPEAVVMPESQLEKIAINLYEKLIRVGMENLEIYFEPGRYLIGDAGVFFARVLSAENDGWIILDVGTNLIPKFAKCSLRFYNISRINDANKFKRNFAGILPTDQDVFVKNYFFTKNSEKGDIIMITNVGAYALTFSNRFPYPLPPIFNLKENEIKKIFDPHLQKDFSINSLLKQKE